jgi:predicted dehydrogenase
MKYRNKAIKWGIIGTGKSAHNFAKALKITKQ